VVVSLRRLDGLDAVDTVAGQVTAGAGVVLDRLHQHAGAAGLSFGVDLGARSSCTVGGMVATNAGGIHVLRHGTTRDQLLGIEAVLGDGTLVRRLDAPRKDNTGYHFPSLLAGSEGTLGIVTAARVRLVPRLDRRAVAVLGLAGVADAVRIGVTLRRALPTLHALELLPAVGLDLVVRHRSGRPPFATPCPVYLVVEAASTVDPEPVLVDALSALDGILDAAVAADAAARERLWHPREAITEALAAEALATGVVPHKMDTALPVGRLAEFAALLPERVEAANPGAWSIAFGHVLDGNLHVNVLGPDPDDLTPDEVVLGLALELGGTISAEHGVGIAKAAWMARDRSAGDLAAMRAIKRALDPDGILNPGVLLP
jgi:FAD/FMN-containing dehydrogenase